MLQEHEQSTNDLRMKNSKRDDELYDAKQAFEAIIIGQNLAMQQKDQLTSKVVVIWLLGDFDHLLRWMMQGR